MPPSDDQPPHAKGKTPTSVITHAQLRRRKVDALRLALSFAFAVKHYLRGEDGVNWDDYQGVLPASFARYDETGFNTQRTTATGSYSAIRNSSISTDGSGRTTPEILKPDATKRVRAKRSKQQLSGQATPLLSGTNRSVEFHPYADEASLPLPLMLAESSSLHFSRIDAI
jgi:putative membrane protein